MSEDLGRKELTEAVIASLEAGLLLLKLFKDGAQLEDLTALYTAWQSDEGGFKTKIQAGVEGYDQVLKEGQDLSVTEIVGLATELLAYVPKYLDALKKEMSPDSE